MLNLTIALLVQRTALAPSPLLSLSSSLSASRFINFNQIKYQHFSSPLFFTNSQSFNLLLSQSTFSDSTEKVAQIDAIKDKYFTSQQDFKDIFKLEILDCKFHNTKSSSIPGGAFHAITQLHSLVLSRTSFINCHSNANDIIGKIPYKISAGAFVFTGAKASVLYSCFTRCTAVGNAKTFFIVSPEHGAISIRSLYIGKNDNQEYKGHYLFCLSRGRCEITSINSSMNIIPEGYAAGAIGYYATSARIGYSVFANNSGNSIFGVNPLGVISKAVIRSSAFVSNKVTKYGVYMRLTGPSRLEDVTFATNQGNCFYGSSPIVFSRCICDCDKPSGLVEDESCQWNVPVIKARHYFKIPEGCNLSEYKNIVRHRQNLRLPQRNQGVMSRNYSSIYNNNTAHNQFNFHYRRYNPFSRYHSTTNNNGQQNPYNRRQNQYYNENINSNRTADTNTGFNSRTNSRSGSDTNSNADLRTNSRYRSDSDANANTESRRNSRYRSDSDSSANSELRTNSRYRSDSNTNENSNTESRRSSRYRSDSDTNENSNTESRRISRYRSDSDTNANSNTESRGNSRYRSDSDANANSNTESGRNSRYRSDSDLNANSGSRINTRYRSDSTQNSESDTKTTSRSNSGLHSGTSYNSQNKSQLNPDSKESSSSGTNSQQKLDTTSRSSSSASSTDLNSSKTNQEVKKESSNSNDTKL